MAPNTLSIWFRVHHRWQPSSQSGLINERENHLNNDHYINLLLDRCVVVHQFSVEERQRRHISGHVLWWAAPPAAAAAPHLSLWLTDWLSHISNNEEEKSYRRVCGHRADRDSRCCDDDWWPTLKTEVEIFEKCNCFLARFLSYRDHEQQRQLAIIRPNDGDD